MLQVIVAKKALEQTVSQRSFSKVVWKLTIIKGCDYFILMYSLRCTSRMVLTSGSHFSNHAETQYYSRPIGYVFQTINIGYFLYALR